MAVVGSGPSAKDAGVDTLRDRIHVIAVNNSYKLCPWADVLYSCDGLWWRENKGATDFRGLRLTYDRTACHLWPDLHKVEIEKVGSDELLVERPSYIGAGGNSGFQALNLAIQFGATGVMLVGFDMRIDRGLHWHGNHRPPLNNPSGSNVARWLRAMDSAARTIKQLGIDVVNCSPVSALATFPKMTVEEALRRWGL